MKKETSKDTLPTSENILVKVFEPKAQKAWVKLYDHH
jgi:hypothetical protein